MGTRAFMPLSLACGLSMVLIGPSWASGAAAAPANAWQAGCASLLNAASAVRGLQLARAQVMAQGMQLHLQGCPYVRVAHRQMRQVLDVRVMVAQSEIASQFVRGPLADGEEVDMGAVQLVHPDWASADAIDVQEDVSPDVLYNRKWLEDLMKSKGWQALPGQWWAFVPAVTK